LSEAKELFPVLQFVLVIFKENFSSISALFFIYTLLRNSIYVQINAGENIGNQIVWTGRTSRRPLGRGQTLSVSHSLSCRFIAYTWAFAKGHCNCLDRRESARLQPIVCETRSGGGRSFATNVRFHAR